VKASKFSVGASESSTDRPLGDSLTDIALVYIGRTERLHDKADPDNY